MSETNGKANELELVWMNPRETKPNPMNWRKHPPQQTQVVESLIFGEEKVGWAGAALFNKTTGNLIDGHDRRGLAIKHNVMMPVLVGSWTEAQEKLILATLDPTTNMAVTDAEMLDTLLRDIHVMDKNITQMLADIAENEIEEIKNIAAPDNFAEYDENITTEHQCPKCGYKWSGGK